MQNPGLSDGAYLAMALVAAGAEFRIAVAGPSVSILLGAVFIVEAARVRDPQAAKSPAG